MGNCRGLTEKGEGDECAEANELTRSVIESEVNNYVSDLWLGWDYSVAVEHCDLGFDSRGAGR